MKWRYKLWYQCVWRLWGKFLWGVVVKTTAQKNTHFRPNFRPCFKEEDRKIHSMKWRQASGGDWGTVSDWGKEIACTKEGLLNSWTTTNGYAPPRMIYSYFKEGKGRQMARQLCSLKKEKKGIELEPKKRLLSLNLCPEPFTCPFPASPNGPSMEPNVARFE